jgi:dephospho-CoA kinase
MDFMPEQPRIVVGVAGRIGSGKTAVAQELARFFGFEYFRYSLVLADWFGANPSDKEYLQEIGGGVMSGEGQLELNRRLIRLIPAGTDSVVDGLRHPLDFASLDAQFRHSFSLIFIETARNIRFERLRGRFSDLHQFEQADAREVESNIDDLKPLASAILPGTLERAEVHATLRSLLTGFREKAQS